MKHHHYTAPPEPWVPIESFDWSTGGRTLSSEEIEILRRLVLQDRARAGADRVELEHA